MTIQEIERWITKFETLSSRGAKIVHVKNLLKNTAGDTCGDKNYHDIHDDKNINCLVWGCKKCGRDK